MFCKKCNLDKSEKEFYFKKAEKRYASWCNNCLYTAQKERWKNRKQKILAIMGGKCSICSYSKNTAALELHHLNPTTKEYDFNRLRLLKWETITNELKKCILLCANCHREIHNPQCTDIKEEKFNASACVNKGQTVTGKCPKCDTDVYGTKYCSTICAYYAKRKVTRPSKDQLELDIKTLSIVKVGKKYKVSDNAIRKWCKFYDISINGTP